MPNNLPSNGYKPHLQLPARSALDPFCWGGPKNVTPEIEVCGGRTTVIVSREEDILVSCPSSTPYVEAAEESLETSFQALEIVNNAYVEAPPVQPRLSGASLMVARVMLRDGYEPRMGLGRNGDGMTSLVRFIENCARFG